MRQEVLKDLRDYVEARQNIQYDYIQVKEDGTISYDAIGFIASKVGFSDSVLKELNGDEIASSDENILAFVTSLEAHGFKLDDLVMLQDLNDTPGSVDQLLEYIDKMIEE